MNVMNSQANLNSADKDAKNMMQNGQVLQALAAMGPMSMFQTGPASQLANGMRVIEIKTHFQPFRIGHLFAFNIQSSHSID